MPNTFLIHGIYGSPEENWFPWLKEKLTKLGCDVHVPLFETKEPTLFSDWLETFEPYRQKISKDSIVIGHSVGVPFLLKILESTPAKAAFFVAGFATNPHNEFTPVMKDIADRTFDWTAIHSNCQKFAVIHSDTDPYVPIEKAQELAEKLRVKVTLIKGAGHFNESAGYTEFPQLLEMIEQELQ